METSMDQSWEKIANHVKRHAIEQQSYNLNTPYEGKISMVELRLENYLGLSNTRIGHYREVADNNSTRQPKE